MRPKALGGDGGVGDDGRESGDGDGDADAGGNMRGDDAGVDGGGGTVIYLTGLSGAGKSTIADALAARLRAEDRAVEIVDGDVLRQRETANLGFDRASREAQMRRAAQIAAESAAGGVLVVSALISPFDAARQEARAVIEDAGARFFLVFVNTPLEVAEARDPKGHYKRARAGEIPDFTGIDSPYEAPADPDLVIDTTTTSVDEAVDLIRECLGL
jgi:sulfate adenylyltransferase